MLSLENIQYTLKGRTLLQNAGLTLTKGKKLGLVGRNGTGKTTLFKLIRGELQADKGEVILQADTKIGFLPQMPPQSEQTALDAVMAADETYTKLMTEMSQTTDMDRLGEIQFSLEAIDAFTAEARAAKVLSGLGFDEKKQLQPLNTFSGGWRMRIALAGVLFMKPDLMLLDEPSNHLDLETTFWLIDYLKRDPCALIIISHDKFVLNALVDEIVHLSEQTLTSYKGNYDEFAERYFLRAENLKATEAKQQEKKAHIQKFVDRFRAKSSKAAQVQSRVKQLSKMEDVQLLQQDPTLPIRFPVPAQLSPPLVTLENAAVGYGETIVLKNLNQRIDPDDCIALVGRNGNGKTTFAKLLAGVLPPKKGDRKVYQDFDVAFFHQDQIENLNLEKTAFDHVADVMPQSAPTAIRALLGQFGLSETKADVAVRRLSGGEKTRLNFAMISATKPGLLILDEPTNHLDIESREALTLSINQFSGAVVLITHDWDLLNLTATALWQVENGTVKPYPHALSVYQEEALGRKNVQQTKDNSRAQEIKKKKRLKKQKK